MITITFVRNQPGFIRIHLMTSMVCTLMLVAVATMASGGSSAPVCSGLCCTGRVTCFVCVKCTETSQLSSHSLHLRLNWASVCWHIAASKACKEASLGFWAIQVQAWAGNVMAGGGLQFVIRHQVHRPGDLQ